MDTDDILDAFDNLERRYCSEVRYDVQLEVDQLFGGRYQSVLATVTRLTPTGQLHSRYGWNQPTLGL